MKGTYRQATLWASEAQGGRGLRPFRLTSPIRASRVQAIGRQPRWASYGTPVHFSRHRPEQTTLYRLVMQHAATFVEHAEDAVSADLAQFVKDWFDTFLECGILAHGFLRLR